MKHKWDLDLVRHFHFRLETGKDLSKMAPEFEICHPKLLGVEGEWKKKTKHVSVEKILQNMKI